jgi:copper chaperone CopZ
MKKILPLALVLMLVSAPALAETIRASVNGLVCAFCATGIEKKFKAVPAVEDVKVDLDAKLVTIHLKKDGKLDDKAVTNIITDAGYTVTGIKREK